MRAQSTWGVKDKILWTALLHEDNSQFSPYLVSWFVSCGGWCVRKLFVQITGCCGWVQITQPLQVFLTVKVRHCDLTNQHWKFEYSAWMSSRVIAWFSYTSGTQVTGGMSAFLVDPDGCNPFLLWHVANPKPIHPESLSTLHASILTIQPCFVNLFCVWSFDHSTWFIWILPTPIPSQTGWGYMHSCK